MAINQTVIVRRVAGCSTADADAIIGCARGAPADQYFQLVLGIPQRFCVRACTCVVVELVQAPGTCSRDMFTRCDLPVVLSPTLPSSTV